MCDVRRWHGKSRDMPCHSPDLFRWSALVLKIACSNPVASKALLFVFQVPKRGSMIVERRNEISNRGESYHLLLLLGCKSGRTDQL